jgi:AraC family transcriptional regulator
MSADLLAKAERAPLGQRELPGARSSLVAAGSGGGAFGFPDLTVGFVFRTLDRHEAGYGTDRRRTVPLGPGAGWLLPAGTDGVCEWSGDSLFLNLHLDAALVAEVTGGALPAFGPLYGFVDPTALAMALDLHASDDGSPVASVYRSAMTLALAAHLVTKLASTPSLVQPARPLDDPRLARVVERIEADLTGDLSLEALAGVAGLSVFHFAKSFKAATGQAPHAFVMARRVERAKVLLKTTALPLMEIAYRVGWENAAHFSAAFKRATGLTPGAFRAG